MMVDSTRLESLRRSSTLIASALPASASSCRRNWLRLNTARLRPENAADWATQRAMPSQIQTEGMEDMNGSRLGFETASGAADFDSGRRDAPSTAQVMSPA